MNNCNPNETKAEQLIEDRIVWGKMFLSNAQREADKLPDEWQERYWEDFADGINDLKAMLDGEYRKES